MIDKHYLDNMIFNLENKKNLKRVEFTKDAVREVLEYLKAFRDQSNQIRSLEEQLKNAIVPKFKIGQEVFYYHIARNKTYSGVVEDIQWFATRTGIYYRIPQLQRDYFWIREDELFATREEAEKRLAELKGEKYENR